jgi:hypothetical protein
MLQYENKTIKITNFRIYQKHIKRELLSKHISTIQAVSENLHINYTII